jgi:nucleoside-diphosphate-sugar epimerase
MRILVTGSEGLIGRALCPLLQARGHEVVRMDIAVADGGWHDVADTRAVVTHLDGCDGVIHLAACSRVVWGEADPFKCALVNVHGTLGVIAAARNLERKPWVLFASSREVYGDTPAGVLMREDAPRRPLNTYAYTKALGEDIVTSARGQGVCTMIVRLSGVYGDVLDHRDRVVPAYAYAAASGGRIVVQGSAKSFDFVHVSDAARGLLLATEQLARSASSLATVHLVTGKPTTLGRLASIACSTAITLGRPNPEVVTTEALPYEVVTFAGDPSWARESLGWEAQVTIEEGFAHLIRAFLGQPA